MELVSDSLKGKCNKVVHFSDVYRPLLKDVLNYIEKSSIPREQYKIPCIRLAFKAIIPIQLGLTLN